MQYLSTNKKKVLKFLTILIVLTGFAFVIGYFLDSDSDIEDFTVTNLSSNSVSLSWTSYYSTIATVQYSKEDNWLPLVDKLFPKQFANDDRDVVIDSENNSTYSPDIAYPRNVHHVTLKNLEAGTKYYLRVNGNLRTFIPPENTITTISQLEKVNEPDTIYSKVVNYGDLTDKVVDGIVYYKILNNNDVDDTSATYSSVIGKDAGWTGDLSNILAKDGSLYKWDKENFSVVLNTRTYVGGGENTYSLADYKPTGDAIVNVQYFPLDYTASSSDVLGLSTDMAKNDEPGTKPVKPSGVTNKPTSPGATTTTGVTTTNNGKTTVITTTGAAKPTTGAGSSTTSPPPVTTVTIPTKDAKTVGTNVTNVYGNTAVVKNDNGTQTPICLSAYNEACGANCSRNITCNGIHFVVGTCTCINDDGKRIAAVTPKDPTTTPTTTTSPKTCPVATIYNTKTGICDGTAVGTTAEVPQQTPTVGGSTQVANKDGTLRPVTGSETNAKLTVGTTTSTVVSSCTDSNGKSKKFANGREQVNGSWCNDCLHIGKADVQDGNGNIYSCKDPKTGWELKTSAKCGPLVCPTISCGGTKGDITGKSITGSSSNIYCDYNGVKVGTRACSSDPNINVTDLDKKKVCGEVTDTRTTCYNTLATLTCPKPAAVSCGGTSTAGLTDEGSGGSDSSFGCFYTYNSTLISVTTATCDTNTGVVTQVPSSNKVICNELAARSTYFEAPLKSDNVDTNVTTGYCSATSTCVPNPTPGYNKCKKVEDFNSVQYCKEVSSQGTSSNSGQSASPCPAGANARGDRTDCQKNEDDSHKNKCSSNVDGTFRYCSSTSTQSPVQTPEPPLGKCDSKVENREYDGKTCVGFSSGNDGRTKCDSNQIPGTTLYCDAPPSTSLLDSFVKVVHAQPIPEVIDPVLLSKGTYRITVPGYQNAEFNILNNNVTVKYFKDDNGDGVRQTNEEYIDPTTFQISVSKITDLSTYKLNIGWNLIGLNFVSADLDKASELAKSIASQGVGVAQISKYDNGNWVHFAYRVNEADNEELYGNDFTLVPGEGYFVRALSTGTISLKGQKFTSSVPINLNLGWNLATIQSTNVYTANTFINKCEALGAQCTTVSKFADNVYESVVKFEDKFFGNNFDLKDTQGYFILNKGTRKIISP